MSEARIREHGGSHLCGVDACHDAATLDTVEAIVNAPDVRLEGLVLTLKLTDPRLAAELPAFHKRIRGWGYQHVRARQLAFDRQEVCVVATERESSKPRR